MVTLGQVGLGYWGPNLLRNFNGLAQARVKVCCDLDEAALRRVGSQYPGMAITTDYGELLGDPEVEAVVVTAPTPAHYELAKAALLTGRHVFVEKPIALAVSEAEELVALAEARGRVLMVGHLLMYHPAVARLKQMVDGGELGEVYYLYASRLNLGQVRRSENAMWSLAPHDISVALHLLGEEPEAVAAQGLTYLQPGIPDTVFLTLRFASGRAAHIHVSWLDPHKVRRITVVGSQKMAVFDDVDSTEKLRIYDKGVQRPTYDSYGDFAQPALWRHLHPTRGHARAAAPGVPALRRLHRQRPDAAERWPQRRAGAAGAGGRAALVGAGWGAGGAGEELRGT